MQHGVKSSGTILTKENLVISRYRKKSITRSITGNVEKWLIVRMNK